MSTRTTVFLASLLTLTACGEPCGVSTIRNGIWIAAEDCPDVDDNSSGSASSTSTPTGDGGECYGQPCGEADPCKAGLECIDLGTEESRCFAPCAGSKCMSAGKISCDPDGVGALGTCIEDLDLCAPLLCATDASCPRESVCVYGVCF